MILISHNQIYVFIACLAFGGIFAIFLAIISLIKDRLKNVVIKAMLDLLFFVLVSIAYLIYSSWLKFPSLRAYMICGVFAGILLSLENFKVILAKFVDIVYNIFKRKKAKNDNERSES